MKQLKNNLYVLLDENDGPSVAVVDAVRPLRGDDDDDVVVKTVVAVVGDDNVASSTIVVTVVDHKNTYLEIQQ